MSLALHSSPNQQAQLHADNLSIRQRIRAVLGGASGNLVEWFDWFVFVSFAIYFSPVFFPQGDSTTQLLQSAAVFALGFIMRPLGAWLIGRLADRRGRKYALTLSIGLMCSGSLLIAVLPGYETIGAAAPALLLVARLLQGFSVGGEYGASASYISEMAGKKRRGFWSTFQCVTLVSGQLLALALLVLLQSVMSEEALNGWGWRIPFVIGALLAVVVFWIRRNLDESQAWKNSEANPKEVGEVSGATVSLFKEHRRATLLVFLITIVGSTGFYVYVGYMQKFLHNTAGMDAATATRVMTLALIVFLVLQPLWGLVSDFVGRKNVIVFSFASTALLTVPVLEALSVTQDGSQAFWLITLLLLFFSGYTALGAVIKAELFPASVRALGVGLPYALANAIFGGSGEFLALWFKKSGLEEYFFYYLAVLMFVGCLVALKLPDSRKIDLIE